VRTHGARGAAAAARRDGASPLIRVGHKGAALIAEGNTPASFAAALAADVDMIEFDVLRNAAGDLVVAHDPADAARRRALSLDEALDLLAGPEYEGIALDVDLKHRGFEPEVVAALRARGLEQRAIVTSAFPSSLRRVGELAPGLRRGLSVPHARRDYLKSFLAPIALAYMAVARLRLPPRAERLLARGDAEVLMAHWMLIGPRLVGAVHRAGGELYAWTVDDARRIARLSRLGVDGVISNDPRLFAASAPAAV
jgi:glycerophosphoryl diester phosphodiesterase